MYVIVFSHIWARIYRGEKIMRKASKTVVRWCKWTGLSLNETWQEPEDRVAWRKHVTLVVPSGLNSQ